MAPLIQSTVLPPISRSALADKSIALSCDLLPPSKQQSAEGGRVIEWTDLVHNSNPDPIRIFTSENNPSLAIDAAHPNKKNYAVDDKFTMTISSLQADEDAGDYICRIWVNGSVAVEQSYGVTIGGCYNIISCSYMIIIFITLLFFKNVISKTYSLNKIFKITFQNTI